MADMQRFNPFRIINERMEPLSDEEGYGHPQLYRERADRWSRWAAGFTALGLFLFYQSDFDLVYLAFFFLMSYFWFWTVRVATNRKAPWPDPEIPYGSLDEIARSEKGEDDVFFRDRRVRGDDEVDREEDRYDPNAI